MNEQLITFETAKLAKEKGFDLSTVFYYTNRLLTEEEHKLGYNFDDNFPPYKLDQSFMGEHSTYTKLEHLLK